MEAGCLLQVAGFVVWEENGGKFSFQCLYKQLITNQQHKKIILPLKNSRHPGIIFK